MDLCVFYMGVGACPRKQKHKNTVTWNMFNIYKLKSSNNTKEYNNQIDNYVLIPLKSTTITTIKIMMTKTQ